MGFVICRTDALAASAGNAHSLSLDLYDQWQAMEKNAQWRFTPPTHVIAAFHKALAEHAAEGGAAGRHARHGHNGRVLVEGLHGPGFEPLRTGRASCREREWQYVSTSGLADYLKTENATNPQ